MRRRGKSPWLEAEKRLVRYQPTEGIAHRIRGGELPIAAWFYESGLSINKLGRLTKIAGWDLIDIIGGRRDPTPAELEAIALAFRAAPELLVAPAADGE